MESPAVTPAVSREKPAQQNRLAAAQALRARATAIAAAQRAVREACTYGELEQLAGVTDRARFWAPFGTDENAARQTLRNMAFERLIESAA